MRRAGRAARAVRLPSGWPRRRAPAWLIPAGVIAAGIAVTIGLSHRPSRQQRAADLHGFLYTVTYDIDSCAGDVRRSLQALQAIDSGSSRDAATAVKIASNGAADCSPANNELIDDLENYVVPESLAGYRLRGAVAADRLGRARRGGRPVRHRRGADGQAHPRGDRRPGGAAPGAVATLTPSARAWPRCCGLRSAYL